MAEPRAEAVQRAEATGAFGDMQEVAIDFLYGRHGPVDEAAARRWLERILASGDAGRFSDVSLGELLVTGRGGPQDLVGGCALLAEHARHDPRAALLLARAARELASRSYAYALDTEDGSDEAGAFLAAYPEALPEPWPPSGERAPDAPALLDRIEAASLSRDASGDFAPAAATHHGVLHLLHLAGVWLGVERPAPGPAPRGVRPLDAWFAQRCEEARVGAVPGRLPAAPGGRWTRFRLDRLRQLCVLLEPRPVPASPVPDELARPTAEGLRAVVDVVKADDVPVFLAALADLDDPVVAELLPRIAPRVHQGRPLAVRLAVRVGATDVLAELLGSAMTARSRGRTVETLVELGMHERAEGLAAHELGPADGPLVERTVEGALMRAALTGRPDPDAFARCLVVIAAVDIGALRRLASLAVRGHPDPLRALTLLADRLLPEPDADPFHTRGAWRVLARVDVVLAGLIEHVTGRRMDSPWS